MTAGRDPAAPITAGVRHRLRAAVFGTVVTEIRTVLWTGAAMLVGQFLLAAHGILAARLLGPAGKGLVTALTSWGQVLGWIAIAGLNTAGSVRLARLPTASKQQQEDLRAVLGNAVAFGVVAGGSVALCAALILPGTLAHLGPGARSLSVLALSVIPIAVVANIIWAVQLSLGRRYLYSLAQVVNPVVMIMVTAGFVITVGLTPGRAIFSTLCGTALSFLVATKGLPWRRLRLSFRSLRQDLRFGLKVHLGRVFLLGNYRLDYLVMSAVLPAAELGFYGTANSFMLPLAAIPGAVSILLTPKVARLASRVAPGSLVTQSQHVLVAAEATRYTLFALIAGVAIAVIGPLILPLVLGSAFDSSIPLMWILTPGYVFLCFSTVVAAGAVGMGRAWVPTIVQGAAIVVTLVLLPVLLPGLQAKGAAITSSIAYAVSAAAAALCLFWLKRQPAVPEEPTPELAADGSSVDSLLPGGLSP